MAIEVYPKKPTARPHTTVTVDTSGIGGSASTADKVLMLIGSATGGNPNTVYRVTNYQQAKLIFRSGELLDAIELAWNPSADGSISAGDILAMRVEDAKQATLTKGGLTITSELYGADANSIQVALEDNSLTSTKRLKVSFANDGVNLVYDNLGKIFKIKYAGAEETATATVTADSVTKKATKLTLTTAKGVVKEYPLGKGVYADIYSLVSDINNLPDFTATFFPIGDKNIASEDLDAIASLDITAEDAYLSGLAGDIKKQTAYNGYVNVEVTGALSNFSFTNLSGGSNGTVPESWASKISLFANEGGYYMVPLTDKPAIHSEVLAFVKDRTDNADPMRAIVGAGYKETVQALITRATRLKDSRLSLVGVSGTRVMDDGRELALPAYMLAAQIGGYACGLDVGSAITFKPFALTQLDIVFTKDQLDQLNENGVISVEFVRNNRDTMFRIVQDVTTYNDKSQPVRNEMSVGEANDFLVSKLKTALDSQFIGAKVVETSASIIKSFIQTFLDQEKRDQEIQGYPAEDVQVVLEGDKAYISFTVYPIRSLNTIDVKITYSQQTLTA